MVIIRLPGNYQCLKCVSLYSIWSTYWRATMFWSLCLITSRDRFLLSMNETAAYQMFTIGIVQLDIHIKWRLNISLRQHITYLNVRKTSRIFSFLVTFGDGFCIDIQSYQSWWLMAINDMIFSQTPQFYFGQYIVNSLSNHFTFPDCLVSVHQLKLVDQFWYVSSLSLAECTLKLLYNPY